MALLWIYDNANVLVIVGDWIIPKHVVSIRVVISGIIGVSVQYGSNPRKERDMTTSRITRVEEGSLTRRISVLKNTQEQVVASHSASIDCIF